MKNQSDKIVSIAFLTFLKFFLWFECF